VINILTIFNPRYTHPFLLQPKPFLSRRVEDLLEGGRNVYEYINKIWYHVLLGFCVLRRLFYQEIRISP